jgi:hypothetical protein
MYIDKRNIGIKHKINIYITRYNRIWKHTKLIKIYFYPFMYHPQDEWREIPQISQDLYVCFLFFDGNLFSCFGCFLLFSSLTIFWFQRYKNNLVTELPLTFLLVWCKYTLGFLIAQAKNRAYSNSTFLCFRIKIPNLFTSSYAIFWI